MVRHKSNNTESYYNRGMTNYEKGEYDKAIADFSEAIKREPDHADAYYNRGNAYCYEVDYDKAITDYTKAIALNPTHAEVYYKRGRIYAEDGDYEEAIADFSLTIALNPEHADAHGYRADLYSDKGFLSRDITVRDLLGGQRDIHHIFPQSYLRELNVPKNQHNQLANLVVMQREINIAIGNTAPAIYFSELQTGCRNGEPPYGGIDNFDDLQENFSSHCIPQGIETSIFKDYDEFLSERRKLMATKIQEYYFSL